MAVDEGSAALAWLPRPPDSFAEQCKDVVRSGENTGARLRALARFDLDENQLNRLANAMSKARGKGDSLAPLVPFRLGILSNSTTDFIVQALVGSAIRHGIALECVESDYGQVMQSALSPESELNRAKPVAVLIALDYRGYPLESPLGDGEAAKASLSAAFGQLEAIRAGIHSNGNAVCILQNLAPPVEGVFGSMDKVVPGALRGMIEAMNSRMAQSVWGTTDIMLDVAGMAAEVGLTDWHSHQQWNLAKLPFNSAYMPLYAERVARTIAAIRGKSRRCLVLDLDNTLWGGVIGDDGLEGIQLAQGDATGEAFLNVQRYALALRERGVVLAVSSKNNDEIAREPFRNHPEMLLREEHIAVFQANWNDKASNIKAIAEELSLGLESLVFLDDNPAERAIVREFLPEVAVPELPSDPADFVRTLSAAGYFEAVTFSGEDLRRAQSYQDNARRIALQGQFADIESYLASLKMAITFQPFDETGRSRITQLINKSNQFNLTTHRYTEAEVAAIAENPYCYTLQVRLADIYGDNGMISVIVCRDSGDSTWEIDTWLMSCRVLGRRVEEMVLREICSAAQQSGIRKLIGKYVPTERNKLVEQHYEKLGFNPLGRSSDGATVWEVDVNSAQIPPVPVEIRRLGYPLAAAAPGD
jgi:FkbH-like protein